MLIQSKSGIYHGHENVSRHDQAIILVTTPVYGYIQNIDCSNNNNQGKLS